MFRNYFWRNVRIKYLTWREMQRMLKWFTKINHQKRHWFHFQPSGSMEATLLEYFRCAVNSIDQHYLCLFSFLFLHRFPLKKCLFPSLFSFLFSIFFPLSRSFYFLSHSFSSSVHWLKWFKKIVFPINRKKIFFLHSTQFFFNPTCRSNL